MKPNARRLLVALLFSGVSAALSGCSDQSRMNMYVDRITDATGSLGYVEADWIGSTANPCSVVQEQAKVTIRLDSPGSVGPVLDARTTGVTVEYYYSDPTDGVLRGPVSALGFYDPNYREYLKAGTVTTLVIPIANFKLKAWSVGLPIAGSPTAAGGLLIRRFVALVTVSAEDGTGKKLSAAGRIMLYLDDYGPSPDPPGATVTASNWCYNYDPLSYWTAPPLLTYY